MANNRQYHKTLAALALCGFVLTLSSACTQNETEESAEQAGNDIGRVVEDGKEALRGVAEGVNDAVYR